MFHLKAFALGLLFLITPVGIATIITYTSPYSVLVILIVCVGLAAYALGREYLE